MEWMRKHRGGMMEDGVDTKLWRRNDGGGLMKEETWSGYEVMERNDGGGMMDRMRNRGVGMMEDGRWRRNHRADEK